MGWDTLKSPFDWNGRSLFHTKAQGLFIEKLGSPESENPVAIAMEALARKREPEGSMTFEIYNKSEAAWCHYEWAGGVLI